MARGGRRQGTPGAQYANRTDMALGPRKLPISTAPNQTYGEAGQQAQAQQAVPMASGPLTSPATAPQPQMAHGDVLAAAQGYQPPPVVPLGMQSLRPDEHVMTPPAGPSPMQPNPVLKGVALLNVLGDQASPEVKALRNVLAAQQGNEQAP